MGLGRQFVLGILGFIATVIFMGYLPILVTSWASQIKPGVTIQTPNFNSAEILELAAVIGALVFLQTLVEKNSFRTGGLVGILRALVQLVYALAILQMTGLIAIPSYGITILVTYVFVSTLIILGVVFNVFASLIKIAVPKEFQKKQANERREA